MATIHDSNGKALTNVSVPSLVINPDFWKKAGIEIATDANSADEARKNLEKAGASYVPVGNSADNLLIIMDKVREDIDASDNAERDACVMLAAIDASAEYTRALNANGKAYTSTLALAKDLFPYLQKSTIAGYIGAGRNVYLPAIQGKFGKVAGQVLMGQSPSNAAILKGVLTDENTRQQALKSVTDTVKKNGKLTARAARDIVKDINDKNGRPGRTGGSTKQTESEQARKAGQTTNMAQQDMTNQIKSRLLGVFDPATCTKSPDGDVSLNLMANQVAELKRLFQEVLVDTNPDTWKTMVFNLMKVMCK